MLAIINVSNAFVPSVLNSVWLSLRSLISVTGHLPSLDCLRFRERRRLTFTMILGLAMKHLKEIEQEFWSKQVVLILRRSNLSYRFIELVSYSTEDVTHGPREGSLRIAPEDLS